MLVQQTIETVLDTQDLAPILTVSGLDHGPDHGVQTRRITPTC
jgi:hypothetical protein